MSYTCYLGGALWPTPEKLQVKIKGKNKTLVLLNEGEVNFLRAPGLTELTVPFDLPMLIGSRSPDYYLGLLERMKANKETTQFMLVRMSPSGGMLFDTNIKVSVEDYNITEDGKKLFAPEKEVIGTCPRCGQPVYEGKKNFACSDRSCGFVLWKNDRFWTSRKKELTKKMAADLLKKGRTNVKGMWSEKKQAAYDAAVILDDTGGKYINFKLEFLKRKEGVNGRK